MYVDEKLAGEQQAQKVEPWREVLLDAAELIERDGKCEGAPRIGLRRCSISAINDAANKKDYPKSIAYFAQDKLRKLVGECIADWSDTTPQAEVVATLRHVAAQGL